MPGKNGIMKLLTAKVKSLMISIVEWVLQLIEVWLVQTPEGPLAVVNHEGPGEADFMQKVTTSDHPFDKWFRNSISGFHGIDFSQPPPGPMPEQMMNWNAE